jgi:hypothetical protein
MKNIADEINYTDCMNREYNDFTNTGTTPKNKKEEKVEEKALEDYIEKDIGYNIGMLNFKEPNTEDAFNECNNNLFNFEDYFTV